MNLPVMTTKWPSLNALKTFWYVARCLSMQEAAAALHVTPTAVSHQIKGLEEELHDRLFERRSPGLKLTASGEALYRVVSSAFNDLNAGIESIRRKSSSKAITVAASPLFASKWLLPRLHLFNAKHVDIEVRVVTTPYVDLNDLDCDIGFKFGRTAKSYSHFKSEALFDVVLEPVCSPSMLARYPLGKGGPMGEAPLLHDDDADTDSWVPGWPTFLESVLKVEGTPGRGGLHFSSAYMVIESAIAGHGWALAISEFADRDVAEGRLIRPLGSSLYTEGHYWMFTKKTTEYDPKVRLFSDWIKACIDVADEPAVAEQSQACRAAD
ncbi:LysR substrate-binding domain-containing protein [Variovorax boronicumulans]